MTNASQKQKIINHILEVGGVSRNWCLREYISRCSAHILQLKREGWEFETIRHEGNYIYKMTKCPLKAVEYRVGDRIIIKYEAN